MTRINRLLHQIFSAKILTVCVLTVTLSLEYTLAKGYQPPSDQIPPGGYSDSSGVR